MISHQHQCVFIHVPKTAGVSVESVFLQDLEIQHADRMALQLGMNHRSSQRPINLSHIKAREVVGWRYLSADLFQDYFKFAFVRDPLARAISTYHYLGYPAFCSFQKYVQRYLPSLLNNPAIDYFVCPQFDYTHDVDGNQLVDRVGKFENIASDFAVIADRLNIAPSLPHKNKTTATPWRDFAKRYARIQFRHGLTLPRLLRPKPIKSEDIDGQTRDLIRTIYEQDFDTFGY